ncbi:hypothetical protein HaLaN_28846 [Haematococcus lacustris]|uniref:Uncharacterized protein n=1 Tax=Haematococcus lacustris TaxID=44745 RepID=A0A6A0ABH5_HAELA|nr:hypothetical protein HaLaN_28846 [Haematococcus lacustris]
MHWQHQFLNSCLVQGMPLNGDASVGLRRAHPWHMPQPLCRPSKRCGGDHESMNCKSPTTVAYEQTDVGNVLHPIFDSQSTADLRPEYEDVAFGSKDERRSMVELCAPLDVHAVMERAVTFPLLPHRLSRQLN